MAVKFEETRWEGVGGKGVGYIFSCISTSALRLGGETLGVGGIDWQPAISVYLSI